MTEGKGTGTRHDTTYQYRMEKSIVSKNDRIEDLMYLKRIVSKDYCIKKLSYRNSIASKKYRIVSLKISNICKSVLLATWSSLHESSSLFVRENSEAGNAEFNRIRYLGGRQYRYKYR